MAEERRRVELELGLDPSPLQEGIQEAERELDSLRRAVERLGGDSPGEIRQQIPFPPGVVGDQRLAHFGALPVTGVGPIPTWDPGTQSIPYLPPQLRQPEQQPATISPEGGGAAAGLSQSTFFQEMRNELAGIRDNLLEDPRRSRARLEMLREELQREQKEHPENYDEFLELNKTIKSLIEILKEAQTKQGFQQFQQILGIANIGQQVMGGNFLGAAGAGIGQLIGSAFGAGALGSVIGSTVGNAAQGVINQAERPAQFRVEAFGTLARFGRPEQIDELVDNRIGLIYGRERNYGYNAEDTLGQIEQARQSRLIETIDKQSLAVINEMQALSRALGMSAEATIALEGTYRRTGGEGEPGSRLADAVSAAISVGMQAYIGEYAELLTSSRVQLVQRTGQGLADDELLTRLVNSVLGGESGKLFRDNPDLAQHGLSGLFELGFASDPGSIQAAMLLRAGTPAAGLNAAFNDPQQGLENAARYIIGNADMLLGMPLEQAIEAARQDPNFVRERLRSDFAQQQIFQSLTPGMTPVQTQALISAIQSVLEKGGSLPAVIESDELQAFRDAYNRDPVAEYQEASAKRQEEMLKFFQNFLGIFIEMQKLLGWIWEGVNSIARLMPGREGDSYRAQALLGDAIDKAKSDVESGTGSGVINTRDLQIAPTFWNELVPHAEGPDVVDRLHRLRQGYDIGIHVDDLAPVLERYRASRGYRVGLTDPRSTLPHPELLNRDAGTQTAEQEESSLTPLQPPTPISYSSYSSGEDFLAGGSDSFIARVVGYSEGNRTLNGGYTNTYSGHRDSGNGAWNRGSFSSQHGFATGEEADAHWLGELAAVWPRYEAVLREHGHDPNNPVLAATFADMFTQSPTTAIADNPHSFLGQMQRRDPSQPITVEDLLQMRLLSYRDPHTMRFLHAFGEEGGTADQRRRNEAILAAVEHLAGGKEHQPVAARAGERTINVNINVNGANADADMIRDSAYKGVMAAEDELDRDFARTDPGIYRNQPRYQQRIYN